MRLSQDEKDLLSGKGGAGAAKAMEILCALGRIHGARDMVEVRSVQVSGISFKNIGEHGLAFLEDWASRGSKARVPAFMNPGGADRRLWKELGFPAAFVKKQERVISALEKLGVRPTLTCAPYEADTSVEFGDHLAWAESSAVAYANSVLGARTNREGGPSAIAAALTGRTPRHTLHTDDGRKPTRVVRVACKAESTAEAGALGFLIGKLISGDSKGGIPYITGVAPPEGPRRRTWLKALGAAMAASGSTGLYHIEGVTPEAEAPTGDVGETVINSLSEGLEALNKHPGPVDVIAFGCPHASLDDLEYISGRLRGRKVRTPVWISTSSSIRSLAEEKGPAAELRRCGVTILADTCIVVAPLQELGIRSVATDSGKSACYLPSHQGVRLRFGTTDELIEAAVEGAFALPRNTSKGQIRGK